MKKRLLFVLPSYNIGGTVVSTKNLILLLDKEMYDISVLVMNDSGIMKYLYDDCNCIPTSFILRSITMESWTMESSFFKKIIVILIRILAKNNYVKNRILNYYAKKLIKTEYDVVIAEEEGICTRFVSYSNIAKKVAWVRCDYSRYVKSIKSDEAEMYKIFDKIVCVSNITSSRFIDYYPFLKDKVYALNNPQSNEFIIEQSKINDNDLRFGTGTNCTIVSVGRFDPIKQFELIPEIASHLIKNNIAFRWYIIGDGNEMVKKQIKENINKWNVNNEVICLGAKTNPHYYINNADILVVLSKSEACPRVINEAKILKTPVVCTDFDTAHEYITNRKNGLIATIENIKYSIVELINDEDLRKNIERDILNFKFNNSQILSSIYKILN